MYEKELERIEKLLQKKEMLATLYTVADVERKVQEAAYKFGAGLNGQDGQPGRDGLNGLDGLDGLPGADGKDGLPGRNGINGKDGKDGANGKDGLNGRDGKDGKDGVGVQKVRIKDGNLIITATDGHETNAGQLPMSKNGGKYARSPYEYATDYGYTGTEAEFYESLINPSGGGVTKGTGIIDFGVAPGGNTAETTVLNVESKATSAINVFLSGTTADHNDVEHLVSDIKLIAAPSDSSFSVSAFSSLRLTGTFKFAYTIA